VRLSKGPSKSRHSGLVQVCHAFEGGMQWGTVCSRGFHNLDAAVICRQLGYSRGEERGWRGHMHTRTCVVDLHMRLILILELLYMRGGLACPHMYSFYVTQSETRIIHVAPCVIKGGPICDQRWPHV
jgi:hypothetical protein